MRAHRVLSTMLLIGGVALVFAGLSAALGFSASGVLTSLAAIVALLYAGGLWFAQTPPDTSVLLFTHDLVVAAGPSRGRPVGAFVPSALRREIEACCRAALEGRAGCVESDGHQRFEAAPVRGADGTIVYGVLLSGALVSAPQVASVV